jgi:hypothetical protein
MQPGFNSPVRTLAAWISDDICVIEEYVEIKGTSLQGQGRGTP